MNQGVNYKQTLRAIGQALEAQRPIAFNIKSNGENYLVRGVPEKLNPLKALFRRNHGIGQASYTPQDIDRLERQGRAKRNAPRGMPDFHSLSNILRTLGAYLDRKDARLLEVYKRGRSMMILYQNSEGHPEIEERTISSIHYLSMQMFQGRKKGVAD